MKVQLGLRLAREKQFDKAQMLFRTAVQDAAANAVLRRLAQTELDRLKPAEKKSSVK